MDHQKFLAQFVENIEGIDVAGTSLETRLADIPQWDSLALLGTLAMVDSEYGVQISGAELQSCATVADIANIVAAKLK